LAPAAPVVLWHPFKKYNGNGRGLYYTPYQVLGTDRCA
jgi:hypothetical protein